LCDIPGQGENTAPFHDRHREKVSGGIVVSLTVPGRLKSMRVVKQRSPGAPACCGGKKPDCRRVGALQHQQADNDQTVERSSTSRTR
jgi:hypothetical protein